MNRPTAILLLFALLTLIAAPALAQPSTAPALDRQKLIRALQDENMTELLDRLTATEQLPDIESRQLKLTTAIRIFERASTQPDQKEQAAAAITAVVAAGRDLIASSGTPRYDSPLRPTWQTDHAERLLTSYLDTLSPGAREFGEFGVLSSEQRPAFEDAVVEALENLSDAADRLRQLQTPATINAMPPELRDKIFTQYMLRRTPYYLALAEYLTTFVSDEHRYFKTLGRNNFVHTQGKTPADERRRLFADAAARVADLAQDRAAPEGLQAAARLLAGRIAAAQAPGAGGDARGKDALDQSVTYYTAARDDYNFMLASLARARLLGRTVSLDAATGEIQHLLTFSPLIRSNPGYRLLAYDLLFTVRLARAQSEPPSTRAKKIADAYRVYDGLLSDNALSEETRAQLQSFIYHRWSQGVDAGLDPADLPATVLLGMVENTRDAGRDLYTQAQNARRNRRTADADKLAADAKEQFTRAMAMTTKLLTRTGELSEGDAAKAKYNHAFLTYLLAPDDPAAMLAAGREWTQLAAATATDPVAVTVSTDAAGFAARLLRQAHDRFPGNDTITVAALDAMELLAHKYPRHPALAQLAPALGYEFEQQGNSVLAARWYSLVPPTSEDYFKAHVNLLYVLRRQIETTPLDRPGERTLVAQQLATAIDELVATSKKVLAGPPSDEAAREARNALGRARLLQADAALDAQNYTLALDRIAAAEPDFGDDRELIALAQSKKIIALVGLKKLADVKKLADQAMEASPDDAAATINTVLTQLENQLDALRTQINLMKDSPERAAMVAQRTDLAGTAESLAQLLVDFGQRKKFDDDKMLPFYLVLVKSQLIAGHAQQAMQTIAPLMKNEKFKSNADAVSQAAEAYFALGRAAADSLAGAAAPDPSVVSARDKAFTQAAEYYDLIINNLPSDNGHYPSLWWNAWMRRLQMADLAAKPAATSRIPQLVAQLQQKDKSLGGDPYRTELKRLQQKYSPTTATTRPA